MRTKTFLFISHHQSHPYHLLPSLLHQYHSDPQNTLSKFLALHPLILPVFKFYILFYGNFPPFHYNLYILPFRTTFYPHLHHNLSSFPIAHLFPFYSDKYTFYVFSFYTYFFRNLILRSQNILPWSLFFSPLLL